jgi:hypothetical protein
MRRASRVDSTHAEVRDALRECGYRVLDTSKYPEFVDFLVRRHHKIYLVEAKTAQNTAGRIKKTKSQQRLEAHGWPVVYLRNREEAVAWALTERDRV